MQKDSSYMARQQLLADDLCVAFANGTQDSSPWSAGDLVPGVSYLRCTPVLPHLLDS